MALLSGLAAMIAIRLCCAFWIATAWPAGSTAPMIAAVGCTFFAAQDDPVPAIRNFTRWTTVAIVIDGIYLFGILAPANGMEMLVLALLPMLIFYGLLLGSPATMPIGAALAANGTSLLGLQDAYSADFASFANSAMAFLIGMISAALVTTLVRSVGAEWSARRLMRANWRQIAATAEHRGGGDRARFAGLLLDRLALLAPRLAAAAAQNRAGAPIAATDGLAELRIGLNVIDLRRARHALPREMLPALDRTLDLLAAYYRNTAPAAPPRTLLAAIDTALEQVMAKADAGRRDALIGLVGLRRGLFPAEAGFGPAQPPPAPPAMAAV
jgi:uncharacterized membrane protein YccC